MDEKISGIQAKYSDLIAKADEDWELRLPGKADGWTKKLTPEQKKNALRAKA